MGTSGRSLFVSRSRPLYTCCESAEISSPSNSLARAAASFVFPVAVGPQTIRSWFMEIILFQQSPARQQMQMRPKRYQQFPVYSRLSNRFVDYQLHLPSIL